MNEKDENLIKKMNYLAKAVKVEEPPLIGVDVSICVNLIAH